MVAFVIPLMDSAYHFMVADPATGKMVSNTKVLPAPQANMMAAVTKGLLEDPANQPWLLYGLGGFVAIMLYMAGVPMLAFALGIYISIPVNMAVLAGAFVAYIVGKTGGSEKVRKARQDQGILIASGLMAGGAILAASSPPSCANLSWGRQSNTFPSARNSRLSRRKRPASRSCIARPLTGTRASWGRGSAW